MEQLNLIGTSNCWEGFTTMYSRFAARQLLSIVMDDEAIVACVFEFLRLEDLAVFSVSSREINSKIRNSPVLQNKILKLRISRLRRPMKTGISCVDQLSIMGDIHESEHFEGGQADALGLAVMFGEKKLIFRKVPPILSPLQAIKKKQSSKMKVNSKRTQKNAEKLMATTKMLTFSQLNKPRDDLKTVQQLQKDARLQKIIKAEVPQTKTYLLEYDEDSSKYIYEIEHKYALKQPDSSYYVRRETLWERLKSNFTERR